MNILGISILELNKLWLNITLMIELNHWPRITKPPKNPSITNLTVILICLNSSDIGRISKLILDKYIKLKILLA